MHSLTADLLQLALCFREGIWEIFDIMRLYSTVFQCFVWKIELVPEGMSNCHISIIERLGRKKKKNAWILLQAN